MHGGLHHIYQVKKGDSLERLLFERDLFHMFYKGMFKKKPDVELVDLFIQAKRKYFIEEFSNKLPSIKVDCHKTLKKKLNFLAIEYYLRRSVGVNTLTQQIHMVAFLCESRREHMDDFVCQKTSLVKGYCVLFWVLFDSIIKFFYGKYLVRRYHLV